ncbi:MAG TPA: hypothetical protein VGM10_21030 [Actinocrinis sp.]|jgi:membrane associated rhomboid family serine protease
MRRWFADRNPLLTLPPLVLILAAVILLLSWLMSLILGAPGVNISAALGGAVGSAVAVLTILLVDRRRRRRASRSQRH